MTVLGGDLINLRYTTKQLARLTDEEFAIQVLTKVLEEQSNPQSMSSSKLRHTIRTLREAYLEKYLPHKSWWEIRIFNEKGKQIPLCEVSLPARQRMYELIQRDYPSGTLEDKEEIA